MYRKGQLKRHGTSVAVGEKVRCPAEIGHQHCFHAPKDSLAHIRARAIHTAAEGER